MKEQDLVLLRLPNDPTYEGRQRHYNTWFRVLFVDSDGTFIGKCERIDRFDFELHKIGEDVRLLVDKVQHTYTVGEQWCYSDNITICQCKGLCENK